ncbi:unnamed protein product [Notodromas monacha]|uniref:HIG1 domain-containing protein n=1 Tax=Notodromas monacha TaxID=399045 RepID=A0A7R9BWA7_9CRUS|nr:unnamed protein product [Notodromas monacha]CAG0922980.1 unnamed protein product [Notodromas monacha]
MSGKNDDTPKVGAAPQLEWIQIRKDVEKNRGFAEMIPNPNVETASEKFKRKFGENPLVPIGCVATGTVLFLGLASFIRRNPKMSQKMMRARIFAQGFTVVALIAGIFKTAVDTGKEEGSG